MQLPEREGVKTLISPVPVLKGQRLKRCWRNVEWEGICWAGFFQILRKGK